LYTLEFTKSSLKELKRIDKSYQAFLIDSLEKFVQNFSLQYEADLMSMGKIKKLQGQKEEFYRLKLRSYRVIYKKYNEKLLIFVIHITTREGAYK